jgi:hypothetical protein
MGMDGIIEESEEMRQAAVRCLPAAGPLLSPPQPPGGRVGCSWLREPLAAARPGLAWTAALLAPGLPRPHLL